MYPEEDGIRARGARCDDVALVFGRKRARLSKAWLTELLRKLLFSPRMDL
jgi:hypothetical protein